MGDIIKYQLASAELLKIHLVDLVHTASFLDGPKIHRNEIEFAVQHTFSGMSAEKTDLLQSVRRVVNSIYEYYDSPFDLPLMEEIYFQLTANDTENSRRRPIDRSGSLREDIHAILQMRDPIGRADVLFAYVVECNIFPERNNTAALMLANACLVNAGAGVMFAPEKYIREFAKLVSCKDHKSHRMELMEMLRGSCHAKIFSAF